MLVSLDSSHAMSCSVSPERNVPDLCTSGICMAARAQQVDWLVDNADLHSVYCILARHVFHVFC